MCEAGKASQHRTKHNTAMLGRLLLLSLVTPAMVAGYDDR